MSTDIRKLTKAGTHFYPQTHIAALVGYGSNGEAIDEEPNAASSNLAKSSGIFIETANAVGHLKEGVSGNSISKYLTVKHGYFNLAQQRYYEDVNYCTIVDVSALKGKTISLTHSSIPVQNAFFVDYDDAKCVKVGEMFDSYPVIVPENANYLYSYLGTSEPTDLPNFEVVEGDDGGETSKSIGDVVAALKRPVHGAYSVSNKRWDYFNHDKEKYTHIVIPVKGGDGIRLTKNSANLVGVYLKSYCNYTELRYNNDGIAHIYESEHLAGVEGEGFNQNTDYTGTAPSDAKYLVLLVDYSSTDHRYLPKEVSINGFLYDLGVVTDTIPTVDSSASVTSNGIYDFVTDRINDVNKALYNSNTHGTMLVSQQKWVFRNYDREQITHILLPVSPGDNISIIKGSLNIVGAFLKDYYIPDNIEYDEITGYARIDCPELYCGSEYVFNQNIDYEGVAPSDAKYLFLWSKFQDGASSVLNYSPASVYINGINISLNSHEVGLSNVGVGFQKLSSTEFNLLKYCDSKTLVYYWYHNHWESQYNGIRVVDTDSWGNNKINTTANSAQLSQAAINFIHMFSDTTLYTGNAHGCTVDKVFEIFIDGQRISFDDLEVGTVINGNDIHIIQQSDGYHPSSQRTSEYGGDGNMVYAKVDSNGVPVLAVRWCLDYHFTSEKETYINKLFICDDNISFKHCFGAMNTIYPVANPHHISLNDFDATYNEVVRENGAWTVTAENGVNLDTNDDDVKNVTKMVQYGDTFKVETECVNDANPAFGKIYAYFDTNTVGGRIKLYHEVVKTTLLYGAEADVFNNGDVISCHVVRNVSIQ